MLYIYEKKLYNIVEKEKNTPFRRKGYKKWYCLF